MAIIKKGRYRFKDTPINYPYFDSGESAVIDIDFRVVSNINIPQNDVGVINDNLHNLFPECPYLASGEFILNYTFSNIYLEPGDEGSMVINYNQSGAPDSVSVNPNSDGILYIALNEDYDFLRVYNSFAGGGWYPNTFGEAVNYALGTNIVWFVDPQTIVTDTDQTVSDEFATWFNANTEALTTVTYDGSVIAELSGGQTKKLATSGKYLEGDIFVAAGGNEPTLEEITITENGEYTPSGDGFSKVTVEVEGSGGIIEDVTELPEVVDNSKIYAVRTPTIGRIILVMGGERQEMLPSEMGVKVVDELPEIAEEGEYYGLLTNGIIYIYAGGSYYTLGEIFAIQSGLALEDKGYISEAEAEGQLEDGFYTIRAENINYGIPNTEKSKKIYTYEGEWEWLDLKIIKLLVGGKGGGADNIKMQNIEAPIPYGIWDIRPYAFYDFGEAIGSVTIPDTVYAISEYAFYGCGIKSVAIPQTTSPAHTRTGIGDKAFANCWGLTDVSIPYDAYIAPTAFDDTPFYNNANNWQDNIFYVGPHLVLTKEECSGDLVIRAGTKYVQDSAFNSRQNVRSITFPDGLLRVGSYAFNLCSSLTSVVLPESTKELEQHVFNNTSGVTLTIKAKTPPTISETSFNSPSKNVVAIYVPAEAVDTYKTADNWSNFADIIYAIEE